jgi:uncharacterized membrane protein
MAARRTGIGNRIAPLRFIVFIAGAVAASFVFTNWLRIEQSIMAGFDVAAALFLVSLWPLFDDDAVKMRAHAAENEANRVILLGITGLVMVVILVSVGVEMAGKPDAWGIALVIGTLAIAWLFSNTVYALHYAHLYYRRPAGRRSDCGGIDFPGTNQPDYWDFLYFAWTLGMTFQTSDVAISDRHVRKVVTFHCLAAFVFNLGVLAFTINTLGG